MHASGHGADNGPGTGPGLGAGPEPGISDRQQALLLAALRRADGAPVSFTELRQLGIEFPAAVVFELELAGLPVVRCYRSGAGGRSRLAGVRLDPGHGGTRPVGDPAVRSEPGASAPGGDGLIGPETAPASELGRRRLRRERAAAAALATGIADRAVWLLREASRASAHRRALAPLALALCAVTVAAVVATGLPGAGREHRPAAAHRVPARGRSSTRVAATATSTLAGSAAPRPRTPVSLALAEDLEARGHALLLDGQYVPAVPVLERALAATGESEGACLEPSTDACLTYAYALYDLGRALRLGGQAAAAVPILAGRLRIDNQRPVVAAELALARQQAG